MKKYEILDHPAELRIRVFGKTKEELFRNAAEAMADILKSAPKLRIRPNAPNEKIRIKSTDLNTLLVDFLNAILAKSQINKAVYNISDLRFKDSESKKIFLEAEIMSRPVERFSEDIKAVTYQDIDIKLITQGSLLKTKLWQTDLVFDI